VAVSFLLFVSVPGLQSLIAPRLKPQARAAGERATLIERVKPRERKDQPVRNADVRRVAEARTSSLAGEGMMAMKLTPDLSVEGAAGAEVAAQGTDLAAEIFDENETDEKPVPLYRPPVPFPQRANELGVQGLLEVEIVVDQTGKVESVNVQSSPHPSFAAEARRVIATWRFKSAKNKGVPVRVRVRQTIEFKLD
jgi:protein TonB